MRIVQIGEFKAHISEAIKAVRAGETIVVSDGIGHEKIAALIPYSQLPAAEPRRLGNLVGLASANFAADYDMTDEDLLDQH